MKPTVINSSTNTNPQQNQQSSNADSQNNGRSQSNNGQNQRPYGSAFQVRKTKKKKKNF